MTKLTGKQDAFGKAMWDQLHGRGSPEIAELDNGLIVASNGPACYFLDYDAWPARQQEAIALAAGRVLDVGAGAGRVALHLQKQGLDVTAIDNSPLAIRVCRARGVRKARVMSITDLGPRAGVFDTLVMFGNNFGLLGGWARGRWLLRRLRRVTAPCARILAETRDPYRTDVPQHLAYHRHNRRRGRMGGQLRLRIRYLDYATPWFDYLMASADEVRAMLAGTGWRLARAIESSGNNYIAVIEKE